jgi:conjugal transfer pilus assembly protein TraB
MKKPLPLLIYDKMSPRNKQRVNMACGALAMITVALVVSGMIGNGETRVPAPADLPKAKPVGFVPGGQLNPQDAWMGGAGKDVATLQSEVRERSSEIIRLRGDMTTMQQQFRAEMQAMAARMPGAGASPAPGAASSATPGFVIPPNPLPTPALNPMGAAAPTAPALTPGAGAVGTAQNQPASFPAQSRIGRPAGAGTPGSLAYPPGSPGMNNGGPSNGAGGLAGGVAGAAPSIGSAPSLMRVSMSDDSRTQSTKTSGAAAAAGVAAGPAGAGKAPRTLANFLPVGFTRAKLLGGLAAPTGGQAQGNPVPVFLRLEDLSYLPNGARAQVKDCLVIAEGFGDASAERAYIRTTLLSCVMRDGRVLEIPIKGAVFGEDGMNGLMGKLVTKQGAILGNAPASLLVLAAASHRPRRRSARPRWGLSTARRQMPAAS